VVSTEGAVYKARLRLGTVTIHKDEASGKYMSAICNIVFMCCNITVIKFNLNVACYMLQFVTINEAVCTKPLQYHIYGLFHLSPYRAKPLRLTALLHPPGDSVTPALFGMITIRH